MSRVIVMPNAFSPPPAGKMCVDNVGKFDQVIYEEYRDAAWAAQSAVPVIYGLDVIGSAFHVLNLIDGMVSGRMIGGVIRQETARTSRREASAGMVVSWWLSPACCLHARVTILCGVRANDLGTTAPVVVSSGGWAGIVYESLLVGSLRESVMAAGRDVRALAARVELVPMDMTQRLVLADAAEDDPLLTPAARDALTAAQRRAAAVIGRIDAIDRAAAAGLSPGPAGGPDSGVNFLTLPDG